jgi:hypothetical protein
MSQRYLVTIRGEFEEVQAVVAETQEDAQEKALKFLGETIRRRPVSELSVVGTKELEELEPKPQPV